MLRLQPTSSLNTEHKGTLQRVRLFQHETFTSIFGPNFATMATRVIIMLAVAGTLVIIAAGLLRPNAPQSTSIQARSSSIQIGAVAPAFTLTTPAGKRISLSDFRGKPVMLNFWYAACPGCLAETPGMQKFYTSRHAGGKDFVILGVNVVDNAQVATQFMQQRGLTYPVVLDQNQHVMAMYNINVTPTSYFIDRHGLIRVIAYGPVDDATLQQDAAQISS